MLLILQAFVVIAVYNMTRMKLALIPVIVRLWTESMVALRRAKVFSRRLTNNSLHSFVPKYNRQSFIIPIFVVLNCFINKRLKLKSSDFMSDLDKCIDSKPNNNTGMHFEKNKL